MKNPLKKYGIEYEDFDRLPEVNDGVNGFMDGVVDAWKANSPVDSGDYRDLVQVTAKSTRKGRGKVGALAQHSHIVEFGSETVPEHATAEKTARQFGGTAHG